MDAVDDSGPPHRRQVGVLWPEYARTPVHSARYEQAALAVVMLDHSLPPSR